LNKVAQVIVLARLFLFIYTLRLECFTDLTGCAIELRSPSLPVCNAPQIDALGVDIAGVIGMCLAIQHGPGTNHQSVGQVNGKIGQEEGQTAIGEQGLKRQGQKQAPGQRQTQSVLQPFCAASQIQISTFSGQEALCIRQAGSPG
jgi:hypothetical protein